MAYNQATGSLPNTTTVDVDELTNSVRQLEISLLDFYAKPEVLRMQIESLCPQNLINREITEKIVSCLVDDNGRNGRDQEYIFQRRDDVQKKLEKQIDQQHMGNVDPFYRAIDELTQRRKIKWNTATPDVISPQANTKDERKKEVQDNVQYFTKIHGQDLSCIKPSIQAKRDIIHFLPKKIFAMMDANNELRRYELINGKTSNDMQTQLQQCFQAENLAQYGMDCSFLSDPMKDGQTIGSPMCRYSHRTKENDENFVLNSPDIIYLLQIILESRTADAAGRNLYYVGKASRGLLSRWWNEYEKSSTHTHNAYKAWEEMQASRDLSGQLSHCCLAYAHVMGYKTQLFIVDQVRDNTVYKMKKCTDKIDAIIMESNSIKEPLKSVWQRHKQGPEPVGAQAREVFPPFELVEWYAKTGKPEAQSIALDVLEQWWIARMDSTANNSVLINSHKRLKHLPAEFITQFMEYCRLI